MDRMATRLVHALKFDGWRGLAPQMARAMVRPARRLTMDEPHPLVPVPLSRARLRERGFNQAELLARGLADETGWALVNLLWRRRTGEQQARLGRRRRAANVLGLFEVDRDWRADGTRSVLLVDDVVTTGATAAACFAAITEAGLDCAGVVSFARATRPIDARR
jgi:ComF family protein